MAVDSSIMYQYQVVQYMITFITIHNAFTTVNLDRPLDKLLYNDLNVKAYFW